MKFELKKAYVNGEAEKWICLCNDARGEYPIVLQRQTDNNVMCFTVEGVFDTDMPGRSLDIIGEWAEPKTKKKYAHCWVRDTDGESVLTGSMYTEKAAKCFKENLILWPAVCVDGIYEEP